MFVYWLGVRKNRLDTRRLADVLSEIAWPIESVSELVFESSEVFDKLVRHWIIQEPQIVYGLQRYVIRLLLNCTGVVASFEVTEVSL